ncbi:MAG: DUF3817 domain-containing protein [Bergeyella sp.]|nr:DUF3817 domain-containing protein [Bergeyella sp.]
MKKIDFFFNRYPREKIIRYFRITCKAEAVSCFLLYGVAMIWKRYDPEGIASTLFIVMVGYIHGLLFVLYLLLCIPCRIFFSWDDEDFVFAILAAFFPFATLWVEKKLAKEK